mmetsp:Transcript_38990/g.63168  ORF Transcript_38990/g.63168 Transcript_38990/m.63168 type:complete len:319 (+) Transcript_38990:170-1126(+)|eukprot:CAMPEP_0184658362 /NCGR_PEP_ID=MMETSP0308-20130426/25196_1 /TAXON_ID=38269 /ORGANISM="Gloeochaete witrockiana, Strain SAG 46.84" /LENGTH=318 /DNA_ID=CAMNT_0027097305 /DNA_START=165 /DNA_END=1121 /DNA_ORIENTATION=+
MNSRMLSATITPRLVQNFAVIGVVIICILTAGFYVGREPDINCNLRPVNDSMAIGPYSSLGFDRVFVLSLARRKDRQERMRRLASDWGIAIEFHFAIDGADAAQLELVKSRVLPTAKLTIGEIAIYGSHYQLSQIIRQREYEHALIFEDDVFIGKEVSAPAQLQSVIDKVLATLKDKYDIIFFGHCYCRYATGRPPQVVEKINIDDNNSTWSIFGKEACMCFHAYALSRRGAEKILRLLTTTDAAVDTAVGHLIRAGKMEAFSVEPALFNQFWQQPSEVDTRLGHEHIQIACGDGRIQDPRWCPQPVPTPVMPNGGPH